MIIFKLLKLIRTNRAQWNKRQIDLHGSQSNIDPNRGYFVHDFSNCDFKNFDFTGYDLRYINFSGANLYSSNFGVYLDQGNKIFSTKLDGVNFSGANLEWARFFMINSKFVDFSNSKLNFTAIIESDIINSNFSKAKFYYAHLCDSCFQKSNFEEAYFNRTDLININLYESLGLSNIIGKHSSYISIDTIINSNGFITSEFLDKIKVGNKILEAADIIKRKKMANKIIY